MQLRYRPRLYFSSPLYQVIYKHFEELQESYQRQYSHRYGHFRHIITDTINRFVVCGDPSEGVARYECPKCNCDICVPFSCKTRLFCPTCHEMKVLLWIEDIRERLLLDVAHRFWTFSIPKRLRPYFMRDRRLLSLLVRSATDTICRSIGNGKIRKGKRPGIIVLIQTHSKSLEWNSHLHLLVTDGAVDWTDPSRAKFRPCGYWDRAVMVELFRKELIGALFKKGVIAAEVADNLVSWKNSGFNVHASEPFYPTEEEKLKNRLAYGFRPAVVLTRLSFDGSRVRYRTRDEELNLEPIEFLARLTLHVPDRYQNIRRYAGFYASNVQRKVRLAQGRCSRVSVELRARVKPNWANLIARVFGEVPIVCPRCSAEMELKEFILDVKIIYKTFPWYTRAPPRKIFECYNGHEDICYHLFDENLDVLLDLPQESPVEDQVLNQIEPEREGFYDQTLAW